MSEVIAAIVIQVLSAGLIALVTAVVRRMFGIVPA